jgi:hypothetical protein
MSYDTLILRPNDNKSKPFSLQVRTYDGVETNYFTLCKVTESMARRIVDSKSTVDWLYDNPSSTVDTPDSELFQLLVKDFSSCVHPYFMVSDTHVSVSSKVTMSLDFNIDEARLRQVLKEFLSCIKEKDF